MRQRRAPAEGGRVPRGGVDMGGGADVRGAWCMKPLCYRGPAVCAESAEVALLVPVHLGRGAAPGQAMSSRQVAHSSWNSL